MTPQRVQLLYGNGGGGHKASASALHAALSTTPAAREGTLIVELVDAATLAGAASGDCLYNLLLSYDAVSLINIFHTVVQTIFPLALPTLRATFRAFWPQQPHLTVVVSFIPMLNAVVAETLPPSVALYTVLTDFSHTPVHPWIQHPRQHLVTGTDVAFAQALTAGYLPPPLPSPSMRVTRTSGMVVAPRFYTRPAPAVLRALAASLKLHPARPTILILFGAAPPTDRVQTLVHHLLNRPPASAVNVIAICGRNRQLQHRLLRRPHHPHHHLAVTGFTTDIPLYMQLADLLIGKPGPGVVSEAFVSGLPCVLLAGTEAAAVMKQERDVLDWVRRARVGLVVRNVMEAAAVSAQQIEQLRRTIADMPPNNAVFEVRDLVLRHILPHVPSPSGRTLVACAVSDARRIAPPRTCAPGRRALRPASLSPTTITAPRRVHAAPALDEKGAGAGATGAGGCLRDGCDKSAGSADPRRWYAPT